MYQYGVIDIFGKLTFELTFLMLFFLCNSMRCATLPKTELTFAPNFRFSGTCN